MSKFGFISRYNIIIKKLQKKPYTTYEELLKDIDDDMDEKGVSTGASKRNFQRDLGEIRKLFGIEIKYARKEKGYFIVDKDITNKNFERIIEAFELFNFLSVPQDIKPFIHVENRKPQGTEHLHILLRAIKNQLKVNFTYQKFWEEESSERLVEPYALKEFKYRWYLIAKDDNDDKIKSFALDRLRDLATIRQTYNQVQQEQIVESYRYCFGIISPNDEAPQDIILSFNEFQGKYIKTLPLHDTQEILVDNENELQIKLRLYITHDLIMELLSFGKNMKVLQPPSLALKIQNALQEAATQYGSHKP